MNSNISYFEIVQLAKKTYSHISLYFPNLNIPTFLRPNNVSMIYNFEFKSTILGYLYGKSRGIFIVYFLAKRFTFLGPIVDLSVNVSTSEWLQNNIRNLYCTSLWKNLIYNYSKIITMSLEYQKLSIVALEL